MSYFKKELNWYWSKRMYVYPFKSPVEIFKWSNWRNIKDTEYEDRLHTYYTEDAIGLNLVTGKKGACGIGIRRDNNERHSLAILQEALILLGLKKDYLWILKTPHEYIIIIDAINGFTNQDVKKYQNIRIVWEEALQLPIKEDCLYPVQFCGNFYPENHPIQVPKEQIYKCVEAIDNRAILNGSQSWWKALMERLFKKKEKGKED